MTITNKSAKKATAPLREQETPAWFYKFGQFMIAIFLLAVSVSYDISVAEVSGDARWFLTHWTALILMAAYFLSCCLNRHHDVITFRAPPIIWLVVFLIVLSSLSMLWTMSPYHSWWSLKHFLGYTAMFGFIYLLRHEKWYTNLLWIVAVGVGFNCLIGITQFHNITDAQLSAVFPPWNYVTAGFSALLRAVHFPDGMDKPIADTLPFFHRNLFLDYFCQAAPPAGTQANKNLFGSYLVLTLPAIFYLLLSSRKRLARFVAVVLFAMGVITLFYIRSRASWLSALCAAIFFACWLLLHQQYRQIIKTFFTKTVLILLAVVCLVTIGGISLRGKLGMRSVIEQVRSLVWMPIQDDNDTLSIRLAYDLNGLAMIKDRPWGVGIGAWHTAYPAYYQTVCPTPPGGFSMSARPSRMHNDIEQAFVELGILGGLAYLGVFLTLLMMTWRIGNNAKIYEPRLLSLCLMTGIVGLGINALMDFPLQLPLAPTLLWSFAGMITGIYVMHVEKPDVGPQKKWLPDLLIYILLTIAAVAGGWAVFRDDWSRRKGDQYLKVAIALASSGRFDEQTLLYLRKSMDYYTWNVRLQEYRALIYPNYTGQKIPVTVDDKIREVEAAIKYDPYSPHKLINLGGLYIVKSRELAVDKKGVSEALKYARQAEDLFNAMLKYPGFYSDLTYTIGGMAHMLQGILQPSDACSHLSQANVLLEKALEFNPNHDTARGALKQTKVLLTHFAGRPGPGAVGTTSTNIPGSNVDIFP